MRMKSLSLAVALAVGLAGAAQAANTGAASMGTQRALSN